MSGERGAGSVLVLSAIMVVIVAFLAVTTLAAGYAGRHRAAAAADLAALAAAGQLRTTGGEPCAEAERVSRANGAALRRCAVAGWEVEVVVSAPGGGPLRWLADPERRARAGIEPTAPAGRPGDWVVPVAGDYRLTARFGATGPAWETGRHTGLDFAAPTGTPVVASAAGQVTHAGPAGQYGNLVVVDHGQVATYYAHLAVISVAVGDHVGPAERVGSVGATGNATGPHLHFEVRENGVPHDPAAVLWSTP